MKKIKGNLTIEGNVTLNSKDKVLSLSTPEAISDAESRHSLAYPDPLNTQYTWTLPEKSGTVALTTDIPTKANNGYEGVLYAGGDGVTEMGKYIDFHATSTDTKDYDVRLICPSLNSQVNVNIPSNSGTLALTSDLNYKNVGALPDYTVTIGHGTAGNPHIIKFISVNYSSAATCFKMGAMTCHDNGISYKHLTDILISVTTAGEVYCDIFKFAQQPVGSVDEVARCTGDVFYVNNTSTKVVDFYILCGQYSSSQFTPITRVGSASIDGVTQYSGNEIGYSGGTKVWANGCGKLISDSSGGVETGNIHIYDDGRSYSLDVSRFSYVEISMLYNDSPGKTLTFTGGSYEMYEDSILDFRISVTDNTYIYIKDGTMFSGGSLNGNYFTMQLQGNNDSSHIAFVYRGYK